MERFGSILKYTLWSLKCIFVFPFPICHDVTFLQIQSAAISDIYIDSWIIFSPCVPLHMYISEMCLKYRVTKFHCSVRATMYTSLSFWSRKKVLWDRHAGCECVICGRFVSIVQNEGNHSCRPTVPVAPSTYLGMSLNSGLCFRFLFCSEVRRGSGDGGREWLEGVGYFLMSMLSCFAPNIRAIELKRMKWLGCVTLVGEARTWICDACLRDENMEAWRLFESWEYECVAVSEMKTWMRDACLWAEDVDVWRLVRWKHGCVTLVCELRMWMCGG